jgi:hypothetical protein
MTWQLFSAVNPLVGQGVGPADQIVVYLPPSGLNGEASIMAVPIIYAVGQWGTSPTAYWDSFEALPAQAALTPAQAVQAALTVAQSGGNTALATALQTALTTVSATAVPTIPAQPVTG